ncbi:MAG: class I SAM-dependent methyltransferase [Gaiellaceae bacterium]
MRTTWDALARADQALYVGDPGRALQELESLFGRLGADPRGGTCVEVGCGPGRMTVHLAERFDRVLAVDVSPAMVEQARVRAEGYANVTFAVVGGRRLDGVEDGIADVVVCYLVLQHLPRRRFVEAYLREIARVTSPGGAAFVQLPVLAQGIAARAWRALRSAVLPVADLLSRAPRRSRALRGVRLTEGELARSLAAAGLRVAARDEGPDAPYRHSTDVFLRLERR